MRAVEIEGKRFNNITVIKRIENDEAGRTRWWCKCDCGYEWAVAYGNLKHIKACKKCSYMLTDWKKHGGSKTRLYRIHSGMKNRCTNPNNYSYSYYGERGITVFPEWLGEKGFENFREWAQNNGYDDTKTIERIDVNGNYEPSNCVWIDAKEQANNTRKSRKYTMNGKTKTIAQWAREYSINYYTLISRLDRGIDI